MTGALKWIPDDVYGGHWETEEHCEHRPTTNFNAGGIFRMVCDECQGDRRLIMIYKDLLIGKVTRL